MEHGCGLKLRPAPMQPAYLESSADHEVSADSHHGERSGFHTWTRTYSQESADQLLNDVSSWGLSSSSSSGRKQGRQ